MIGQTDFYYFAEVLNVFNCGIVIAITHAFQKEFILHYKGMVYFLDVDI
ncbi:hypothetical protein HJ01_02384 [Flavobacterium frigoris PS1]|uniref:Uncharacterized protein n=1 Tax=Flavobacterium frigoris (strain PS1) TaxID=1086011 RepID=H7FSV4_FLAFP|nr:hypothetical protein HJ01_02384 [Flavobacterium frigoris PS1]